VQQVQHVRVGPAPRRAALAYQNRDIVGAFCDRFEISEAESRALFDDTKRWLWLHTIPGCPRLVVTEPIYIIDEMWHNFVLHTKAYAEYCTTRLGRFIHHLPTAPRARLREERAFRRNPDAYRRRRREKTEAQYAFISEHLGSATLARWYAEYPLRYGREWFARYGIEVGELHPEVAARLRSLAASDRRVARAA